MSDAITIGVVLTATVLASLLCVALMNRLGHGGGRKDQVQPILDRDPLFGKVFLDRYYPDLPRQIVFEVRSEFARLAGVPADFLLPEDKLSVLGLPSSPLAMQQFITALVNTGGRWNEQVESGAYSHENLDTLDECIRAAVELWRAPKQEFADALSRDNAGPESETRR